MTLTKDNVLYILKNSDTIDTTFFTTVRYEIETESEKRYILELVKNEIGIVNKITLYYNEDDSVLFELTGGDEINEFIKEVFESDNPLLDAEY